MTPQGSGESNPSGSNAPRNLDSSARRGLVPASETRTAERAERDEVDREIAEAGEVDKTPSPNEPNSAPIGTLKDALKEDAAATTEHPKEDASEKKKPKEKRALKGSVANEEPEEEEEEAPITSLAQLRDYHIKHGSAPTQEEVDKVKALEKEIAEEGAKRERVPNSETK